MRNRWWAAPAAAASLALLAACGSSASTGASAGSSSPASTGSSSSSAGSDPASSGGTATGITTAKVSEGMVLTNSAGFTLYWFAKDTPTTSNCNGSCATYWPPVTGKPTMAGGAALPGKLGTIKRADGQLQATYDGHPLYLYKGDSAAGQDNGNDLNASGALWWAMTPSGAKLTVAAAKPSSSSSSKSGGSGW